MGITVLMFFLFYMIVHIVKFVTVKFIGMGQQITIIPNFLYMEKQFNKGAAFGLGADSGGSIILVSISAVASIILMFVASRNDWKRDKVGAISITMALAGCVGNLYDRFITLFGANGVVDMFNMTWFDAMISFFTGGKQTHVTMNVADIFLVIGLIIFVINYLFFYERKRKKAKSLEFANLKKEENTMNMKNVKEINSEAKENKDFDEPTE